MSDTHSNAASTTGSDYSATTGYSGGFTGGYNYGFSMSGGTSVHQQTEKKDVEVTVCYRPQRSCGKVMFLHLSVGGVCQTHPRPDTPRAGTSPQQTHPSRRPLQQTVCIILECILVVNMSHFSYSCKTEQQNGISRLISELLHTLDSSLRDHLFHVTEWTFPNSLVMQTC